MAPKEDPSSHRSPANSGKTTDDKDTESGIVDKRNVNSDSKRAGLVEVIRKWLFDYHGSLTTEGEEGNMEGGNLSSSSSRYRLTATIILTFASVYLFRNRQGFKSRLNRIWPALFYLFQQQDYLKATTVSLSFLRSMAEKGLVERVLLTSSGIIFLEKNRQGGNRGLWRRSLLPPNSANLQSDLLEALAKGGCSDVSALPESLLSRLATPLLTALPFVYLAILYRILKNMHGGEDIMQSIQEGRGCSGQTTFRDVAGLGHVQQEVAEIVSYLADPGTYRRMGATPPKGILLHGPPGAGKTLCAKAVAGEARCDAFIACSGSDFCEMFVGRGAARVRALFGRARSSAKAHRQRKLRQQKGWFPTSWFMSERSDHHPASAIIFIDELDALAKSRSYGGLTSNDERDQTLNQLLTEMDGFPSQDEDVAVMVIAATNRAVPSVLKDSFSTVMDADSLDPAILRRFDRQIHVGYPNADGRREIFRVHARRIRCNVDEIDWDDLASDESTGGFLGADIQNIVNDAALLAVRERSPDVNSGHLKKAVRRAREMKGDLSPNFSGAIVNKHLFHYHHGK